MQPSSNRLFAKRNQSQIALLQNATDLKSSFCEKKNSFQISLLTKKTISNLPFEKNATDLKSPFCKTQPVSTHRLANHNRSHIVSSQKAPDLPSPFRKHSRCHITPAMSNNHVIPHCHVAAHGFQCEDKLLVPLLAGQQRA
jgi:hypothetical protein